MTNQDLNARIETLEKEVQRLKSNQNEIVAALLSLKGGNLNQSSGAISSGFTSAKNFFTGSDEDETTANI